MKPKQGGEREGRKDERGGGEAMHRRGRRDSRQVSKGRESGWGIRERRVTERGKKIWEWSEHIREGTGILKKGE